MSDQEKHIKSNMEAREISPSDSAWERLETQLEAHQPAKQKPRFLWLGIAASLLILFSVGYFFLYQETPDKTPVITNQNTDKQIIIKEKKEDFVPKYEAKDSEHLIVNKPKILVENPSYSKEKISVPMEKLNPIADEPSPKTEETILVENVKPLQIEPEKEVNSYEKISSDELLANAWKKCKLMNEQKIAINSDKLLNHIEDEIYEEKSPDILERLTNQIKSIQLALSERNELD